MTSEKFYCLDDIFFLTLYVQFVLNWNAILNCILNTNWSYSPKFKLWNVATDSYSGWILRVSRKTAVTRKSSYYSGRSQYLEIYFGIEVLNLFKNAIFKKLKNYPLNRNMKIPATSLLFGWRMTTAFQNLNYWNNKDRFGFLRIHEF